MSERTIRLLEDRVSRVTLRIRELIAEKARLDEEIESLRDRLEALEREEKTRGADAALDWAQVAGTLRAAVDELRRE
jgi:regulator of replication initiation timing